MPKNKLNYEKEKLEIIKTYDFEKVKKFINGIKGAQKKGIKTILEPFVPAKYKGSNNDQLKFGDETIAEFVKTLNGGEFPVILKMVNTEQKRNFILDKAISELFSSWIQSYNIVEAYCSENEVSEKEESDSEDLINFMIEYSEKYGYTKEMVQTAYDFAKDKLDEKYLEQMKNCVSNDTLELKKLKQELLSKESIIEVTNEQIDKLNKNYLESMSENLELQKKLSDSDEKHQKEIKKLVEGHKKELSESKKELEKMFKEHKKVQMTNFKRDIQDKDNQQLLKRLILEDESLIRFIRKKLNLESEIINNFELYSEKLKSQIDSLQNQRNDLETKIEELKGEKVELESKIVELPKLKEDSVSTLCIEDILDDDIDVEEAKDELSSLTDF